jgi:hypothetical protein
LELSVTFVPTDTTNYTSATATVTIDVRATSGTDMDGDGKSDLLWRDAIGGDVWLWPMDGATRLSRTWVATAPVVGYQIIEAK